MARQYQVTVGNIGTVYDGESRNQADMQYNRYVLMSADGIGRASNESVTLWCDGEILDSYEPDEDEDEDEDGLDFYYREGNPTAVKKPQTGSFSSPYDWGGTFTIQSSGRPKTAILWADTPDEKFRRDTIMRAADERAYSGLLPVVYPLGDGQYAFPPTLTYFAEVGVRRGNRNLDTLATLGWDAFCKVDGNYYVLAFVGEDEVPPFGVANPDDKKRMPKAIVGKLTNFTLMPPPKRTSNPSGRVSNPPSRKPLGFARGKLVGIVSLDELTRLKASADAPLLCYVFKVGEGYEVREFKTRADAHNFSSRAESVGPTNQYPSFWKMMVPLTSFEFRTLRGLHR